MKTIGIKLADGSFYPVLEEGSPEHKNLELTTAHNNQTKVMVDLYRSATCSMNDAEYVDSLQIENLKQHPTGEANISFTVAIDENNQLSANIIDEETGRQSQTEITLISRTLEERLVTDEYKLSDYGIKPKKRGGLLAAASKYAASDIVANEPGEPDIEETAVEDQSENQTEEQSFDDFNLGDPEASSGNDETPHENTEITAENSITDEIPSEASDAANEIVEENSDLPDLSDFNIDEIPAEVSPSDETVVEESAASTEDTFANETSAPTEENDFSTDELPDFNSDDLDSAKTDDFSFDFDETPAQSEELKAADTDENPAPAENTFADETSAPTEENDFSTDELPDFNSDDLDSAKADDFSFDFDETPAQSEEFKAADTDENPASTEDTFADETSVPTEENDFSTDELPDFNLDNLEPSKTDENPAPAEENDFSTDELPDFNSDDLDSAKADDFSFDFDETPAQSENTEATDAANEIVEENSDLPDLSDFNIDDTENSDLSDINLDDLDDLSNSSSESIPAGNGISFTGLYDKETELGESSNHEGEDSSKKTRIPVIICVICAIICVIATLLILFIIPSKYNLLNKKADKKQETEIVQNEPVPEPEPFVEEVPEPVVEEIPEPIPEAKEDEIVIVEKAEEVVPEQPPVVEEKPKDITYKIKWGDTLWDISDTYYKNPWRYKYIARFNKIKDPDYIISGTTITIPAE